MSSLSVAVITLNEEANLAACLESVAWADELVVLDSGSTDGTQALAQQLGARVAARPFTTYAEQKNAALDLCKSDWILSLDADERVSEELGREIRTAIAQPGDAVAFDMPRLNFLLGRWMRYGLMWRERKLRLVRRGHARWQHSVHEVLVAAGPPGRLHSPLLHYANDSISDVVRKCNRYTSFEADAWRQAGVRPSLCRMLIYPPALFFYAYVLRLGLLDGAAGFIHAVLMAWYTFLKRAKLWEPARQAPALQGDKTG